MPQTPWSALQPQLNKSTMCLQKFFVPSHQQQAVVWESRAPPLTNNALVLIPVPVYPCSASWEQSSLWKSPVWYLCLNWTCKLMHSKGILIFPQCITDLSAPVRGNGRGSIPRRSHQPGAPSLIRPPLQGREERCSYSKWVIWINPEPSFSIYNWEPRETKLAD